MNEKKESKGRSPAVGILLLAISLFALVCITASLASVKGVIGSVGRVLYGVFGISGIFIFLITAAIGAIKVSKLRIKLNISTILAFVSAIWSILLIVQLATARDVSGEYIKVSEVYSYGEYLSACYNGKIVAFGGAFTGITFWPIFSLLGLLGSWVVFIGILGVSVYLISGFLLSYNFDAVLGEKKKLVEKEAKQKKVSVKKENVEKQAEEPIKEIKNIELPPIPEELKATETVRRVPDDPHRRKARSELFGTEMESALKEDEIKEAKDKELSPHELLFGDRAKTKRREKEPINEVDTYTRDYERSARTPRTNIAAAPISNFGDKTTPKILHETEEGISAGFGVGFVPGQGIRQTEVRMRKTRTSVTQNKDLLKYKESDLYYNDSKDLPPIIDGEALSQSLRGVTRKEEKPEPKVRMNKFGYPETDSVSEDEFISAKQFSDSGYIEKNERVIPVTTVDKEFTAEDYDSEEAPTDVESKESPIKSYFESKNESVEKEQAEDISPINSFVPPVTQTPVSIIGRPLANGNGVQMSVEDKNLESAFKKREYPREPYKAPPLDCLEKQPKGSMEQDDLQAMANILEDTLSVFKISAEVKNIIRGPSVARFELSLPPGVSINKVINLSKDIERELCARSNVRLLTHIPNKNLFGIEVPLNHARPVYLRTMLESPNFQKEGKLRFALGMDIEGNCLAPDLADMPHLLMGGSTGNGKSVCLNSLIISLLYKYSPEELRFIIVDPKFVEFSYMKDLPHMLMPQSIPTAEKAVNAFAWLVNEMDRRYSVFSDVGVRNIKEYNDMIDKDVYEPMARIVLIVDELNDLMSYSKHECESKIMRLAQKARAAGIHLVLATQRPSVDVVTGPIKANLPGRIALKVTSVNDSRTILDSGGPEKLSGPGDMLFQKDGAPIRVQGAFVSGAELDRVATYIRKNNVSHFYEEAERLINEDKKEENAKGESKENDRENDPYFIEALKLAITTGNASISMLQRKFKIGFGRAGSIVEAMEAKGYVSAQEQNKPRTVFLTPEQFNELYGAEHGKI